MLIGAAGLSVGEDGLEGSELSLVVSASFSTE